jgi:2-succinyl-5-enolpyruvyl-6-hydroxy-3-cyclohexene-1-carboxylate synthase
LAQAFCREGGENAPDGVLRLGGVPTCRLWRDLESKLSKLPVLSLSDQPFAGLTRGECLPFGTVIEEDWRGGWSPERLASWVTRDYAQSTLVDNLLLDHPRSEPGMVRALSRLIPAGAALYLGNSLPIREWDLAACRDREWGPIGVNRGANGIDGQLSTFLGFCRAGRPNWALLGDLTTLYDLSAPWILPQLPELPFVLAVMNNGGGQIFSRMFARPEFQNRHATGFHSWAQMWGLDYQAWQEVPEVFRPEGAQVLELLPDENETSVFWREYDRLW